MASIAKSFSTINLRGLLLTVFVAAMVIGLFFIPELITVFRGKNSTTPNLFSSLIARDANPSVAAYSIDGVSEGIDINTQLNDGDDSTRFEQLTGKIASAKRNKLPDLFANGVSWSSLRQKESVSALRHAQGESMTLSKLVPAEYPESRFALYNFSGGINFVLSTGEKTLTADQAFRYLERLDLSTTESLIKEGVQDDLFNQWINISLGPVFKHSRLLHQKESLARPFNPALRLESAFVRQHGAGRRNSRVYYPPYVDASFSIRSKEIKRIDFFHNGSFVFSKKANKVLRDGRRVFSMYGREARGIYSLRIVDKTGQIFEKSYTFYAPAQRFPWSAKAGGIYMIPLRSGDPIFDRMFALNAGIVRGTPATSYLSEGIEGGENFSTF